MTVHEEKWQIATQEQELSILSDHSVQMWMSLILDVKSLGSYGGFRDSHLLISHFIVSKPLPTLHFFSGQQDV